MRATSFLALMLGLLFASGPPSLAAEKTKGKPDPAGLPLWSSKSGTLASRQYLPGLNATLLLSDEQVAKLHAAWQETVHTPELRTQSRQLKEAVNPTEAQRAEVRKLHEVAEGQLQTRVKAILSRTQQELMASIEVVYGQAREAVNADLTAEFGALKAKTEEAQRVRKLATERLAVEFQRRLTLTLTPQQLEALRTAAAEEQRREAEATAKK